MTMHKPPFTKGGGDTRVCGNWVHWQTGCTASLKKKKKKQTNLLAVNMFSRKASREHYWNACNAWLQNSYVTTTAFPCKPSFYLYSSFMLELKLNMLALNRHPEFSSMFFTDSLHTWHSLVWFGLWVNICKLNTPEKKFLFLTLVAAKWPSVWAAKCTAVVFSTHDWLSGRHPLHLWVIYEHFSHSEAFYSLFKQAVL